MTISRRAIMLTFAVAVLLAGATIISVLTIGKDSKPTTFSISGSMTVSNCYSSGSSSGYSDLLPGAQVEVTAQNGEVLGVSTLKPFTNDANPDAADLSSLCIRVFTVPDIPTGRTLYGVHIGNTNRGIIWKNEVDARAGFILNIG
jgi:hypothetical protein